MYILSIMYNAYKVYFTFGFMHFVKYNFKLLNIYFITRAYHINQWEYRTKKKRRKKKEYGNVAVFFMGFLYLFAIYIYQQKKSLITKKKMCSIS